MKGGHCLTVRISRPWMSEWAFAGIARAGTGRGRWSISAGSQRKIMRMKGLRGVKGLAWRSSFRGATEASEPGMTAAQKRPGSLPAFVAVRVPAQFAEARFGGLAGHDLIRVS